MSSDSGSPWFERWFDRTYLEIYAHRDAAEAERGTQSLLAPLGLAGSRCLDVACGAGRWVRALTRHGAHAVGTDLSEALLRAGRDAGPEAYVRGDMRRLPFQSAGFDLVLCMFTSFGYFATAAEDRTALAEMARVLRPGGDLVLDILNAVRVRRELVPETRRTVGGIAVRETRRLEADGDKLVKEIDLEAGSERRHVREEIRLWTPEALAAACADAGLEVRALHGDYDSAPFDAQGSPRLIVVARRRP